MNFIGMSAGAAALLVLSVAAGEHLTLPADGETKVALVYLVAATVALFLFVLVVVQRWTASSTSYVFVLMPVVAVVLGAIVADEQITATTILGGGIVSPASTSAPSRAESAPCRHGNRPLLGLRSSRPPSWHAGGTRYAGAEPAVIAFSASCWRIIRAAVASETQPLPQCDAALERVAVDDALVSHPA